MKRHYHLRIWPVLCVVALDQVTKWAVVKRIPPYGVIEVIPGFFNLVHIRNPGIAFGLMGQGQGKWIAPLLLGLSFAAIILLIWWSFKAGEEMGLFVVSLSVILGGAIGNVVDRLRFGEVIDFLDFHLGQYHWPAFNVADSAITIGTFCLAYCLLLNPKR